MSASETVASIEQVCAAADAAFDSYRSEAPERRAQLLEAIAENILGLGEDLLAIVHAESRLPMARLIGERARTVGQLKLFAEQLRSGNWQDIRIDPALPDRQPLPRPDLRLRKLPLGPVAVFGASNFPLAFSTAGGDTASALAAGCPVVVKGHPAHPQTHALISQAIKLAITELGLPEGVFGEVSGEGHAIGAALVQDPRIAAVGFTGSRQGGLALRRLTEARPVPIPIYAEMSSINPVVILPGALSTRGTELGHGFAQSLTLGAGQFCTNPGLVLVVSGQGTDAFLAGAADAVTLHQPQPMLTSDILSAYSRGASNLAEHSAVSQIAIGLAGDGHLTEAARIFQTDAADFLADDTLGEEVFGAASLVVRCQNIAQLIEVLTSLEGQLTATLHLDDTDYPIARKIIPLLERKVGRILVNGWPTGVEVGHAMVHGGPFPATTDGRSTSVGTLAIDRFLRPVCYQDFPRGLLPAELRDDAHGPRIFNGERQ